MPTPRTTGTAVKALNHYVAQMDDGEFLCRRRRRHDWPSERLRRGENLPDGIHTEHQPDGSYVVTEHCLDCGKRITWTTEKYGVFTVRKRRSYEPYAVVIPQEVEYKPSDLQGIHMQMVSAVLFPSAPRKRSGTRGGARARGTRGRPAATPAVKHAEPLRVVS